MNFSPLWVPFKFFCWRCNRIVEPAAAAASLPTSNSNKSNEPCWKNSCQLMRLLMKGRKIKLKFVLIKWSVRREKFYQFTSTLCTCLVNLSHMIMACLCPCFSASSPCLSHFSEGRCSKRSDGNSIRRTVLSNQMWKLVSDLYFIIIIIIIIIVALPRWRPSIIQWFNFHSL